MGKKTKETLSATDSTLEAIDMAEVEVKLNALLNMRGEKKWKRCCFSAKYFKGLVTPQFNNIGNMKPMSASLCVISRLAEEFEQIRQVFGDDAKFLVEVKSGQVDESLDPDRELRRLKQMFESWKKDYGTRLRRTKVVLNKLESEDGLFDKGRKKWWGSSRRNNTRII